MLELLEGRTLREVIADKPLEIWTLLQYAIEGKYLARAVELRGQSTDPAPLIMAAFL